MRISNIRSFLKIFCFMLISFTATFNQVTAKELSDNLFVNGFFTADLTVTDEELNLISNVDQLISYEENKPSFKNSLIGAQVEYQLANNWNAVIQGKLYADENSDITGDIDWAYLSYDFGNDLSARVGKFQVPFLQGIELRNISYARLWARPLIPSSGAGGYNEFSGLELLKHFSMGDGNWDLQLSLGKPEHGLNDIEADNIKSMSVRYQHGDIWIRSSILHTEYSAYTKSGIQLTDSGTALMASIEAEFSLSAFLFNMGYSTSDADITPNDTSYYLSVAYPVDDFTPFVYVSHVSQHFDAFQIPSLSSSPPKQNALEGGKPPSPPDGDDDTYSYAAGLRYYISEHYAVKMQAEHINSKLNSGKPNNTQPEHGNALTIVLEGVF